MVKVNNMNVAVVQMTLVQTDVRTNITHLAELVESRVGQRDVDLLLLPEMWTTGFMTRAGAMTSEDINQAFGLGITEMKGFANGYQCAVYGSLIESVEEGHLSNTGVFVTPDGQVTTYRKRHLFGPGGERKYFVEGEDRVQVEWMGWQIRLTICYDLRFPVWQRQDSRPDCHYDILLNCANWPSPRIDAWEILLKARAVENQCYVLASNRTGDGPKGLEYPGYSMVLGARGEELAEGKDGAETVLFATLERESLDNFREKFPVLQEIDNYILPTLDNK